MKKIIIAGHTVQDALATMRAKDLNEKQCIILSGEQSNVTRHWIVDLKGLHGFKKDSVIGSKSYLVARDYPEIFKK